MSNLGSPSTEIKANVSRITNTTEESTLDLIKGVSIEMEISRNPEISIFADGIGVSVDKSHARLVSSVFFKEYELTGDNVDFKIPPAHDYRGILRDVNQIVHYGIDTLVIADDHHAHQLSGLATLLGLSQLTSVLELRTSNFHQKP